MRTRWNWSWVWVIALLLVAASADPELIQETEQPTPEASQPTPEVGQPTLEGRAADSEPGEPTPEAEAPPAAQAEGEEEPPDSTRPVPGERRREMGPVVRVGDSYPESPVPSRRPRIPARGTREAPVAGPRRPARRYQLGFPICPPRMAPLYT